MPLAFPVRSMVSAVEYYWTEGHSVILTLRGFVPKPPSKLPEKFCISVFEKGNFKDFVISDNKVLSAALLLPGKPNIGVKAQFSDAPN